MCWAETKSILRSHAETTKHVLVRATEETARRQRGGWHSWIYISSHIPSYLLPPSSISPRNTLQRNGYNEALKCWANKGISIPYTLIQHTCLIKCPLPQLSSTGRSHKSFFYLTSIPQCNKREVEAGKPAWKISVTISLVHSYPSIPCQTRKRKEKKGKKRRSKRGEA